MNIIVGISLLARIVLSVSIVPVVVITSEARAELPADGPWPAQKVVDMHTHLFNARDIPLAGILANLNVPWPLNSVLADILRGSTAADEGRDLKLMPGLKGIIAAPALRLSDDQRSLLEDYVATGAADLAKAYRSAEKAAAENVISDDPALGDTLLVVEALQKAGFPPGEAVETEGEFADIKSLGATKGYLRFVGVLVRNHRDIANYLRYSVYKDVDLFVHHMMDMEKGYADSSANPFSQQIHQAQIIDERHDGVLGHFVAFDPFRRTEALPLAQLAHAAGGLGIKFYPPTGYRATENFFPPEPRGSGDSDRWKSKYQGWSPKDLDNTIDAMFTWAEQNQVPIFTHCTPYGFQGYKGYGMRSDPNGTKLRAFIVKKCFC